MIDFHGFLWARFVGVLAWLVLDWSIKEFAFGFVKLVVSSAVQNYEVSLPAVSQFIVFLGRWKGSRLSFFEWHSRLSHYPLDILVWCLHLYRLEVFRLRYLSGSYVWNTWKFILRICITEAKNWRKLFWWFSKVLSEKLMVLLIALWCRHLMSIVPLWWEGSLLYFGHVFQHVHFFLFFLFPFLRLKSGFSVGLLSSLLRLYVIVVFVLYRFLYWFFYSFFWRFFWVLLGRSKCYVLRLIRIELNDWKFLFFGAHSFM